MRISDWSSDVCSSDLCQSSQPACEKERGRERYNMKNRIKIGLMLGTAGALGWTPAYAQAPAEAQIAPALPQAVAPAQAESTDPASNVGIGAIVVTAPRRAENVQQVPRSEERRVGKACASTCGSRWSTHT